LDCSIEASLTLTTVVARRPTSSIGPIDKVEDLAGVRPARRRDHHAGHRSVGELAGGVGFETHEFGAGVRQAGERHQFGELRGIVLAIDVPVEVAASEPSTVTRPSLLSKVDSFPRRQGSTGAV